MTVRQVARGGVAGCQVDGESVGDFAHAQKGASPLVIQEGVVSLIGLLESVALSR